MRRHASGVTLIELLVALAVFAIIFGFLGSYLAQQIRVTGLSQTINETEAIARTVAESVLQDLQLAGSRVAIDGGIPRYAPTIGVGCTEANRASCVLPITFDGSDIALAPAGVVPDGVVLFYRTSVDPGGLCRRVDYAYSPGPAGTGTVIRSDIAIACPGANDVAMVVGDIDLVQFATDVDVFQVWFRCAGDGAPVRDPRLCYETEGGFVRQAEIVVGIELTRRDSVRREVAMSASTPNLRPGVDYLRDIP